MRKSEKEFYPDYLIEIVIVIFIAIELAVVLSLLYPQVIGRQIDFATPYRPLPEWYFLWLYQVVRYFPGKWAFFGTVLFPLIAVLTIVFIPYIDRGKGGRLKATLAGLALLFAFIVLTLIPYFNP